MIEPCPEAEAGHAGVSEPPDELPLPVGIVDRDARGEQKLSTGEPRRRIEQLSDVHPPDLALGRDLASGHDLEAKLGGEALDGEHHGERRGGWFAGGARCPMRREASSRTGRRTSTISSNCSVSAISGGENWITGSPRSSVRQIRPRR